MIDLLGTETIKALVAIGRDILKERVLVINRELLEKKIENKEKEALKKKRGGSESFGQSGGDIDTYKELTQKEKEEIQNATRLTTDETLQVRFNGDPYSIVESVSTHHTEIGKWCETVNFKELRGIKYLHEIYIELEVYLMPQSTHLSIERYLNGHPI